MAHKTSEPPTVHAQRILGFGFRGCSVSRIFPFGGS